MCTNSSLQSSSHMGRARGFSFMLLHMQSCYRWAKQTGSEIREWVLCWGHKSDFPFKETSAGFPILICKPYFPEHPDSTSGSTQAPFWCTYLCLGLTIHPYLLLGSYAICCRLFSIASPRQSWRWYLDCCEARAQYLERNWALSPYPYLDNRKIFFFIYFIRQYSIKIGLNTSYCLIRHQLLSS